MAKDRLTQFSILLGVMTAAVFILEQFDIIPFGTNAFLSVIVIGIILFAAIRLLKFSGPARIEAGDLFLLLGALVGGLAFFVFFLPNSPFSVIVAKPVLSTLGVPLP